MDMRWQKNGFRSLRPTGIRDDGLSSGLSTGPSFHRPQGNNVSIQSVEPQKHPDLDHGPVHGYLFEAPFMATSAVSLGLVRWPWQPG